MDRTSHSFTSIMCCSRMLFSRAYWYGQMHSSAFCCTDVWYFDIKCDICHLPGKLPQAPVFLCSDFSCDRCISLLEQPDSGEIHVGWSEPFDTRQRTASPAPAENRQDLSALQSVEQKTYWALSIFHWRFATSFSGAVSSQMLNESDGIPILRAPLPWKKSSEPVSHVEDPVRMNLY